MLELEHTPLLQDGAASRSRKFYLVAVVVLASLGAVAVRARPSSSSPAALASTPAQQAVHGASALRGSGQAVPTRQSDGLDAAETAEAKRPHIILFTVDDMGWNDVGYQSTDLPEATPFMNALVKKSVKLTHYYAQPSCTPSRVAMMTGKFPYQNGFQNVELQVANHYGVPMSNRLLPQYLQEIGYKTVMYGKWNIGHCNAKYLPSERGFDHFIGYLGPGHGYANHLSGKNEDAFDLLEAVSFTNGAGEVESAEWHTGEAYQGTYDTLLYRDKAVSLLKKHAKAYPDNSVPLFMWSAQHGIHGETDVDPNPPKELLSAANEVYLTDLDAQAEAGTFWDKRKVTASVLMSVDNALKRLIEVMEETGLLDNAVVFVNSDNGAQTDSDDGHPGNNFPMRSMKFSYFEGGIRVPAFVYAPGRLSASRVGAAYHGLMHHVDLLATFFELGTGATPNLEDGLDSVSHWSAIAGDGSSPRDELVLNLPRSQTWRVGENATEEGVALRVGKYKLLLNHAFDGWWAPEDGHQSEMAFESSKCQYSWYTTGTDASCSYDNFLFDVEGDPHEKVNLWGVAEFAAIQAKLVARAEELAAAQSSYGSILYAMYMSTDRSTTNYKTAWQANNWYVSPWGCEVVP